MSSGSSGHSIDRSSPRTGRNGAASICTCLGSCLPGGDATTPPARVLLVALVGRFGQCHLGTPGTSEWMERHPGASEPVVRLARRAPIRAEPPSHQIGLTVSSPKAQFLHRIAELDEHAVRAHVALDVVRHPPHRASVRVRSRLTSPGQTATDRLGSSWRGVASVDRAIGGIGRRCRPGTPARPRPSCGPSKCPVGAVRSLPRRHRS